MDQSVWEMHVIPSFDMQAYSVPIHCTDIARNFGPVNGQCVPTRAFDHKKDSANTSSIHVPYNLIDLQLLILGTAPNLFTLHTPQ